MIREEQENIICFFFAMLSVYSIVFHFVGRNTFAFKHGMCVCVVSVIILVSLYLL